MSMSTCRLESVFGQFITAFFIAFGVMQSACWRAPYMRGIRTIHIIYTIQINNRNSKRNILL